MKLRLKLVFILSAPVLVSCASANYHLRVEWTDPSRDPRKIKELATQMTWAEAEDIQVVYDLPAGAKLDEKGNPMAADSEWELVAKVGVYIDDSYRILTFFGLWGYEYPGDENWRNGYCSWQIPLSWITLTLWSWYTPFYWPCRVSESNDVADVKERQQRMLNLLKRATKAAGGTILMITRLGNRASKVPDKTGPSLHSLAMVSAKGYVFRKRK